MDFEIFCENFFAIFGFLFLALRLLLVVALLIVPPLMLVIWLIKRLLP